MFSITTHNSFLFTRKEFWFYNGEEIKEGTYNVFSAAKQINEQHVNYFEKYQTTEINLSKTEEELFNAIHPTYRYDIRSSEKHNFQNLYFQNPTDQQCKTLIKSYNAFAKTKGLNSYSRRWVSALQESGNFCFTKILLADTVLATHVYVFDKKNIMLANSFHNPEFQNSRLRSEANKLLHWKDILLFKKNNFCYYDFGGVNHKKLPGVSKFKLNFGGEKRENYRYIKTSFLFFKMINTYKNFIAKYS